MRKPKRPCPLRFRHAWDTLVISLALMCIHAGASRAIQGQEACEWSLDPSWSIGAIDGPEALSPVLDLAVGPDGYIYVAQQFVPEVAVFNREGGILKTIGRAGNGPGEFDGNPVRLGWVSDTLWVADRSRVTLFSEAGDPLRRIEFSHSIPEEGSVFVPGRLLRGGTFLARRRLRGPEMLQYARARRLPLRRFAEDGDVLDALATVPKGPSVVRGNRFSPHPLWEWDWNGVSSLPVAPIPGGAGVVFASVGSEAGARDINWFELIQIDARGDTILHHRVPYEPRPITGGDAQWLRNSYAAYIAGDYTDSGSERPVPGRDRAARERDGREARDAITIPESYPPVRKIVVGADGSIWVLRELRPPEFVDRWEVYTSEGRLEGLVTIADGRAGATPWAPRLNVLYASREEVWGTVMGEFDVPYLRGYRVERSCR